MNLLSKNVFDIQLMIRKKTANNNNVCYETTQFFKSYIGFRIEELNGGKFFLKQL